MKDPFPIPPSETLMRLVQPVTDYLNLASLPLHVHEVLFAFCLYTFVGTILSPYFSARICPKRYKSFNKKTRINWDVHVVSFFQSVLICALSLYVTFYDEERKSIRDRTKWEARTWEYTGMGGLCQSFALGYFLWDLIMCAVYVNIFGVGMLAHAISAVTVFAFGYRPFIYFYAPVFLLYELSSPFLNIHWFCDKLDLTGSTIQAVNGAFLVGSFFGCRLIWGNLSSVRVFYDIYMAITYGQTINVDFGEPAKLSVGQLIAISKDAQAQRYAFRGEKFIPTWLGLAYLASNITLNSLNIFWFGKMIQTIRTRFDPPWGTKGVGPNKIHWEPQDTLNDVAKVAIDGVAGEKGSVAAARKRAEEALNGPVATSDATQMQRAEFLDSKNIEVSGQRTLRTRRKA